jgi:hypothetical protein
MKSKQSTKQAKETKQPAVEDLSPNQPKDVKGGLSLNYTKITYN